MKTIVVPTDLSARSEIASSVVVTVARTHQADGLLVHSIMYPTPVLIMRL